MTVGSLTIKEISKGKYRLDLTLDLHLPPHLAKGDRCMQVAIGPHPAPRTHDDHEKHQKLTLSVDEVIEHLNVGRSIVYDLIRSGQLQSIKIGRLRRIPLTCLHAYIDHQINQNT